MDPEQTRTPPTGPSARRRFSIPSLGIAAGLALLALALRSIDLGLRRGLDVDEAYYILLAQGGVWEIVTKLAEGAHPPLYFLLLNVWTDWFGVSEAACRSLSALFGVLHVVAIYLVASRLFSSRVGLISMLLLCVSPIEIFYSREARMYSLLPLLSLAVFYLLSVALERNRRRDWIALALALVAACYTHNYGVFLVPACALSVLTLPGRRRIVPLGLALTACALCYLPWLGVTLQQTGSPGLAWMVPFFEALPPIAAVARSLEVLGAGGKYLPMNYELAGRAALRGVAALVYGSALVGFFASFFLGDQRRETPAEANSLSENEKKLLLLSFLLAPLVIPWIASLVLLPIYVVGRYDIIALPFYCMILGYVAARLPLALQSVFIASIVGLSAYSLYPYYFEPAQLPSREVAEHLERNALEGDSFVFFGMSASAIRVHFLRADFHPRTQSFPSQTDRHPGWIDTKPEPEVLQQEAEQIVLRQLESGRRIWLVRPNPRRPIDGVLLSAMDGHFEADRERSKKRLGLFCLIPRSD